MKVTPYARVPHAMVATFELDELSPGAERVFWRLYLMAARRKNPMLGYLVDQHMHGYSLRDLERICSIPRSTVHDNLPALRTGGLVAIDTAGAWYMPPVQLVEGGFAKPTASPTTTTDAARSAQLTLPLTAVDNSGTDPPWVSELRTEPSELRTPLPSISSRRPEDVRGVDESRPGENSPSQLLDRVPQAVVDTTCRYLVAKLAATSAGWRGLVDNRRDRAALERCYQAAPAATLEALQQAADDPGVIRNPGAWLTRTVPAIAMAGEVAS